MKNNHRRSRNKLPRRSSNSLKQELRNGKFNLPLFNRLYTNKTNKQYSLDKYLKYDNIYDDYHMILNDYYDYNDIYNFCCNDDDNIIHTPWQCTRCSYINIERLSYCNICELSYHENINYDSSSYSSLSSYINDSIKPSIHRKKIKIKRKKMVKNTNNNSFKFDDQSYKKFKKYMKKRKTSIIAHKKVINDNKYIKTAKIEQRRNNANKLYTMYDTVYLSRNKHKNEITEIINKMTSFIPPKSLKIVIPETFTNTVCKVCYIDTKDVDDLELVSMNKYCSHCMICQDCFIQYLQITISDDENILPWLLCPEQDCKAPICCDLLLKYISINNLYIFAKSFIYKHLQRSSFWINCPDGNDKQCKFGWIVINEYNEYHELKCNGCGYNHILNSKSKEEEEENGFDALIDSGILRGCPQCNYPAMKDYGICNVMHCAKCGIYWNWRTKEIGTSTNEIKQNARSNGTLWEQGELSYQQDLERNNLPQFIALLKKNGIKYDPNYRRGS